MNNPIIKINVKNYGTMTAELYPEMAPLTVANFVKLAESKGIRDKVKIMVGGAPVNEDFCKKIGADCYTNDAASAADKAVEFCK